MAKAKQMKALARPKAGKGAARAERRAGRVPGVIYGDGKPPVTVSVDHKELRERIYAGRFLTTIYELEVDGTTHRVIPRDFQLDAGEGSAAACGFPAARRRRHIRVRIPVHVSNADQAPGVKRGGTVNIVTHAIEMEVSADDIPEAIDVDHHGPRDQPFEAPERRHAAAERARDLTDRHDAGHDRAAVGLRGRNEGGRGGRRRCRRSGCRCRRSRRCAGAEGAAATPARRSGCCCRDGAEEVVGAEELAVAFAASARGGYDRRLMVMRPRIRADVHDGD